MTKRDDAHSGLPWHGEHEEPVEKGWYLVDAVDGRFRGRHKYHAWGNGSWWIPAYDGWMSSEMGVYRWKGPVADIDGPAPDGTDPRPKCLVGPDA